MRDIAKLTFKRDDFLIVMNTLMKRLNEPGKNWRHVYKALLVIDYILKNGSRDVESYCRQHIVEIRTLTRFQYIDQAVNKDVGLNVRERTKIVLELINDSAKLEAERKRSSAARNKYVGVSSEDAGYGGRSYSSSSATSISYDDPYDEYQGGGYSRDSSVPSTSPAPASDDEGGAYDGVGMANEVSYDYDYADSSFAAREEKKTKPAEQPKPQPQSTVMLDLFGDTTPTTTNRSTTTTTTTGGSFFDMTPAPAATTTTTTGGSFFDMAPAATTTTTTAATTTTGGSFFDMTPAAPAPAQNTSSNAFFGSSFTATTTVATSSSTTKTSSDPFPAAFGDFEAAAGSSGKGSGGAGGKSGQQGNASFDVLSMVNLDSLGAKPAAGGSASSSSSSSTTTTMGGAQRRTPMGAMGPATGPAFVSSNAMGAPSMATSSGSILTPTTQPNYAALSQQQNVYGGMGAYGGYGMQQQQGMYGQQQQYGGMGMGMGYGGGYGQQQNQQNGFF